MIGLVSAALFFFGNGMEIIDRKWGISLSYGGVIGLGGTPVAVAVVWCFLMAWCHPRPEMIETEKASSVKRDTEASQVQGDPHISQARRDVESSGDTEHNPQPSAPPSQALHTK